MRRVMVVGQPGSGKSTLAREPGAATGGPVVRVGRIHWPAGRAERPRAERTRLCPEAEAGEAWEFEGGHSATWPSRLARAGLLAWPDRPVGLRLRRILRRLRAHCGRARPDMAEGREERLATLREFVRSIWRTRRTGREGMARLAAGARGPVLRLASDREVAAVLDSARRRWPPESLRGGGLA